MTQKTDQWYAEASAAELHERAAEMRGEFSTLRASRTEGDRATYDKAIREFRDEVEGLDIQLALRASEEAQASGGDRNAPAGVHGGSRAEDDAVRSAVDQVMEHPEFKNWLSGTRSHSSPRVQVDTSTEGRRDILVAAGNTGANWVPAAPRYFPIPRQRRLVIRDLMTVIPTQAANHQYVQEVNPTTNQLSASTVAEGASKPDSPFESILMDAPVRDIAALVTISNQALRDTGTLRVYLERGLNYRIKLREELQILRGNGIAPDVRGLLTYAGIQTQATAGPGEYAMTLGLALSKIEVNDGEANGIAMNPATYWLMMTHRVAGGSNAAGGGQFDAEAFTASPVQYVWGVPVVKTNSLNANENVVADWKQAGWLWDREAPALTLHPDHLDYAAKNKVLLRIEEAIAVGSPRPDLLCVATTS